MSYTIANIPTQYRGRMYRSRLEARWAAFFDRLGLTHEYEPFDLGTWSPDFAITNPFDALVEVKPATDLDTDLADRVALAGDRAGFRLITRVAPAISASGRMVSIGWWPASREDVGVVWRIDGQKPTLFVDLVSFVRGGEKWFFVATGEVGSVEEVPPDHWSYPDYTMKLWADACNAVQWEPTQ